MEMNFRLWLEGREDYEKKFAPRAKHALYSRNDPFASWFPEHMRRIYVPLSKGMSSASQFFNSSEYFAPEDREVIDGLKEHGFEVLDYRNGYVRRGKGSEKIGGVLNRLIQTTQDAQKKSLYQKWLMQFQNSKARMGKNLVNELWVVISRNPHDIAQMSYDKDWTSCMELESGVHKNAPFCMIRSGGMVAYLMRQPEAEVRRLVTSEWEPIEKPLARIAIKAARGVREKKDVVIAIPEETVYGTNIKGFWETVWDWLEEKQGNAIGSGRYKVLGGYTDTWGDNKAYQHAPRDEEGLISWLSGTNNERRIEAALKYIMDSRKDFSEKMWKTAKNSMLELVGDGYFMGDVAEMLMYMIHRKPEMFSEDEIKKMPYQLKEKMGKLKGEDYKIAEILKDITNDRITHNGNTLQGITKVLPPADLERLETLLKRVGNKEVKLEDSGTISNMMKAASWTNTSIRRIREVPGLRDIQSDLLKKMGEQFSRMTDGILEALDGVDMKEPAEITRHDFPFRVVDFLVALLNRARLSPERVERIVSIVRKMVATGTYAVHQLAQSRGGVAAPLLTAQLNNPEAGKILGKLAQEIAGLRGFKAVMENMLPADGPVHTPNSSRDGNTHQKLLLKQYLDNGSLSADDMDDVQNMLDAGWAFQDAMSAALKQSNHRKQLSLQRQVPERSEPARNTDGWVRTWRGKPDPKFIDGGW